MNDTVETLVEFKAEEMGDRYLYNFPALADKIYEMGQKGASKVEIATVLKRYEHNSKLSVYDRINAYFGRNNPDLKEFLDDKEATHKAWAEHELSNNWCKKYLKE